MTESANPACQKVRGGSENDLSWALATLGAGLFLSVVYIFFHRFNSDEPQHLHIAWGWAHGLMQYRDVFDNHTPLFHLLTAPLVRLFGDRYDLQLWMRMAMLPLYAGTLACTFFIAKRLYSVRLGIWAAALTGIFLPFLEKTIEFRTDVLWSTVFVLAVAVSVGLPFRPARGFLLGVIFGTAFAVSMKSSVLLACFVGAAVVTAVLNGREAMGALCSRKTVPATLAFLLGLAIVPAVIIAWFVAHGAWADFYYGTIQHNLLPTAGKSQLWKRLLFLPAMGCLLAGAQKLAAAKDGSRTGTPAYVFLFLLAGLYFSAILFLWPLPTDQDSLPMWPVVIVLLVPFLDGPAEHFLRPRLNVRWQRLLPHAALILFALLELALILFKVGSHLYDKRMTQEFATWKAVLDLTEPGDMVMDPKGEFIFRKRAYYYAFETITRARMGENLLPDNVQESLVAAHTCVVYPETQRYTPRFQEFVHDNYLSVGPLLVAGKMPAQEASSHPDSVFFDVNVPAEYAVVTDGGPGKGLLDGKPFKDGPLLEAGRHTYHPAPGETNPVLLWARAVAKGYNLSKLSVENK